MEAITVDRGRLCVRRDNGKDNESELVKGMSNIDESSGNLIMKQIYYGNRTKLDNFQFSLLIAPSQTLKSMMTIGGYRENYIN